jgi:membrane protein implicated in regulation of membrane protease activity
LTLSSLLEWWNFIFVLPLGVGLLLGLGLALSGLMDDLGHSEDAGTDVHDVHGDVHDVPIDAHDLHIEASDAHAEMDDVSHDVAEGDAHNGGMTDNHMPILPHESHPELVKSHDSDSGSSIVSQMMALFGLGIGLPLSIGFPTLMILWGAAGMIANGLLSPVLKLPALYVPVSVLLSLVAMAIGGRTTALVFRRAVGNNKPLAVRRGGLIGSTGYAVFEINAEGGVANVKDPFGNIHRVVCRTLPGEMPMEAGTEIIIVRFEPEAGFYYVEENPFDGNLRLPKAQNSALTGEQTLNQQQ